MSATLGAQALGFWRTPFPLRLARASGMLLLCCVGAFLTTHAHYLLMYAIDGGSRENLWTPWREAWLGGFFWPAAIFGALWAWSWSIFRLWDCRWIRAGILITSGNLAITLLFPLLGIGMFPIEFLWIAFASVGFGEWKVLARS